MNIKLLLVIITFLLSSIALSSQVVINEFSASNLSQFMDSHSKYEDWIEFYNTSSAAYDVGGMYLSDKMTNPTKWIIPPGTSIPANGFLIFWCSGRDTLVSGEFHTNFKLSQTSFKDSVLLSNTSGSIIEAYALDITHVGHSRCRVSDGASSWKVCATPTLASSNNGSSQYNAYAYDVEMSLSAGFYAAPQTVSLSTFEPNSTIHYTLDGNAPTITSPIYGSAIAIDSTTILKATAFSSDTLILPGLPVTATYFINENFSLPVMSIGADYVQDLANGDGSIKPVGSIEYFDANGIRQVDSYGTLNRHGQDSWALNQRSIDWVSRDEMGHSKAIFNKLFTYSDRDEYQRVILRASGDDNYPAINDGNHDGACHIRDEYVHILALEGGMKLDVRAVERVVVYLNGDYWGVYGMRERPVDHDYIKEYYGHGKYDLLYLSTWGSTEAEYGGQQAFDNWIELRDFILNNDMGVTANYQIVKDNIRLTSMCDYFIANLNSVASDWLNYNTGWYRGLDPNGNHKKWGYILWDNDATFDYYINYSGVPNTSANAKPCDIDDISTYMDQFFNWWNPAVGMHEKIFLKLQDENPEFRQLYFSRQADLINTVYTCDNMLNTLDSMVATIDPEMDRQIARWGGTRTEWENNIATLRSFVSDRCLVLADGMIDCFEVTGPYNLTLNAQPPEAGIINLNTITIEQFPWTGQYFGNMENLISVEANPGYTFSHWETSFGTVVSPDVYSTSASVTISQAEELIAVFQWLDIANTNLKEASLDIYPNIVTDKFTVEYQLETETNVDIQLFSTMGVQVIDFGEQFNTAPGRYTYQFDILSYNLAKGAYLLKFQTRDTQLTKRLIIIP